MSEGDLGGKAFGDASGFCFTMDRVGGGIDERHAGEDGFADEVIETVLEEEEQEEARNGDDETAEGGEESDGDVTGERRGFGSTGLSEGGEGADHADDGSE